MYIPLLAVAHGLSPIHCENTQLLREAITEDDDDDEEKQTKLSQICSYGIYFQGSQERVRNSRGKRAISVRAIEVLL